MSSRLNIPKGRSYQRFPAVSKTRIQLKYLPKSFYVSKLTRLLSSSLKWILPQRMQVQTVNNWSQVISIRAKTTKYHCNCEDLANGFHSPFCFVVFSRENLIIWVRWREILQLFNNFAVLSLFPVVCSDKKIRQKEWIFNFSGNQNYCRKASCRTKTCIAMERDQPGRWERNKKLPIFGSTCFKTYLL